MRRIAYACLLLCAWVLVAAAPARAQGTTVAKEMVGVLQRAVTEIETTSL